jgi:hypothetical protein
MLSKQIQPEHQVQVAENGETVWIHALDGSTVGRFSKRFGLDVHTTVTDQLAGAAQCLHCTHEKPSEKDWVTFCDLMKKHYGIEVNKSLVQFK